MAEAFYGLCIFRSFIAIEEAIYAVNIYQAALNAALRKDLTAYRRTKTVAYEGDRLDVVRFQHFIDGAGEKRQRIINVRFVALAITGQIYEYKGNVFVLAKSLELLFPGVEVAAEAVNKANCQRIGRAAVPNLVVYRDAVVDCNDLRLYVLKSLRRFVTSETHTN